MNESAFTLIMLGLILDLLPIISALRWNREDRAPPSVVPVIPWFLYLVACAIWKQEPLIRMLGLGVLTFFHLFGFGFVNWRRKHWIAERQQRTLPQSQAKPGL